MDLHTYAALYLSHTDENNIQEFLQDYGIAEKAIRKKLHMTIYEAPFVLRGVNPSVEDILIQANINETRFMVMAPGGEVAQPGFHPNERMVGIRFTRRNKATPNIDDLRRRFADLEAPYILGSLQGSTARRSIFGSPQFQPHVTLLDPGSGVNSDLTLLGQAFRSEFKELTFDLLEIRFRKNRFTS